MTSQNPNLSPGRKATAQEGIPVNNPQVMIIEDNAACTAELEQMLGRIGYDIFAACHAGEEPAKGSAQGCPDVILLDIARPGQDSSRILAGAGKFADIPVVCIASPDDEEVLMEIKGANVYGCLSAPVREHELEIALGIALSRTDADRHIRKSQEELRKYRIHLEAVISRRTAELKKTNAHLNRLLHFIELTERKLATDSLDADIRGEYPGPSHGEEGVITVDPEMNIVLVNAAAQHLLGWTEDEAVGKPVMEVFSPSDAGTGLMLSGKVKSMISTGSPGETLEDIPVLSKTGDRQSYAAYIEPIFDLDDKTAGVVLTFRDATESRKAEHEVARSRKLESLNVMVRGLAHDFNNILSSVLANIQLAKVDLQEGSHSRDRLNNAEDSVLRARELSQQMLTFSGGEESQGRVTDLAGLIEKTGTFSVRGSGSKCEFILPSDLWEVPLEEDTIRGMLNDIFLFLDGLQPGGGRIDVAAENVVAGTAEPKLRPVDYVKIRFHIHGHVIPETVIGEIFRPGSSHAFALDLSHTESMIKKSGGVLDVKSTTATGTGIVLYLPARVRVSPLPKKDGPKILPGEEYAGARRILLMDDEDAILSATSEMLKFLGYEVAVAHNGEEALDLFRDGKETGSPFHAVILDITVPGGMGAQETLPKLVAIDPDVNAIISSGYSTSPMILDYQSFGYISAIVKPYGFKELGEALDKVFR